MINSLKSLKYHQGFIKYFKNTSWLLAEKILRMIVGLFVIVWLTRYLGPRRFGLLAYSQSLIGIFIAFSSLGLDVIIVRELVKQTKNQSLLLGTAFFMKLTAGVLSMIVIFIINFFSETQDESNLLTSIIIFCLVFQGFNVIDTYFQSKVISKYVVCSNTIAFTISSILKIVLIFIGAELQYFAYALVFDSFIIAIGYFSIYRLRKQSVLLWRFDKVVAKYLIKSSWPLMLVTVSAFIYTRTDQIMIKWLVNSEAVGQYAAAIRVSELFYFIPGLIAQSTFPKIIEAKNDNNQKEYFKLLEMLYRITIWIAIPIALGMCFGSHYIVAILYGSKYLYASTILSILAFGIIFNAIGSIFIKILYAEHFERKYLYRSIIGVLVNIILNYFFIQKYGAIGAAVATLITLFIIHYIYDLTDKDLRKFYYMKFICFRPF
jgi:O-antigen/teichoic acid export membrane protein